jgi:hypothetical protein
MKKIAIIAALAATAAFGAISTASAVEVDVGPGGVRVGEGYRHHHWDHGYRAYGYGRGCRVIVTKRINRFGERVTERRRICD